MKEVGLLRTPSRGVRGLISLLLVSLVATGSIASQALFMVASGGSRSIRPGTVTCVYDGKKLSAIRVTPPEARSLPGHHRTFAKWQAVLQKRADSGRWRKIVSTGFDPPFTTLTGSQFKRLAPRQRFQATLPSSGYLRIKVDVRWSASSGAVLGRQSDLSVNYRNSSTRGCPSLKNASPLVPGVDSPIWWGNLERTRFHRNSTIVDTRKGLHPVVGDFDGDGKEDILWYDANGREKFWWGQARRTFQRTTYPVLVGGGFRPLAGDFDNDGADDIYWYRAGSGNDFQWWGSTGRAFEVTHNSDAAGAYDQVLSGDFNGDGFSDIFFYRHPDKSKACEYTGAQYYWYGQAGRGDLATGSTTTTSECYYRWFTGDVDGNGRDDQLQYGLAPNPRDFLTFNAPSPENVRFDRPYGFRPVMGDFDGDTRSDIFWFSPSNEDAQWWGAPIASEYLNGPRTRLRINGDYSPVSGDFNGDGRDDILWYAK